MSGFKRMMVSINPDEVRKIIRFPMLRGKVKQDNVYNPVTQPACSQNALEELRVRQSDYEQMLAGFNQSLRDTAVNNQNAIFDCQNRLANQLQEYRQDLWTSSQETVIEIARQAAYQSSVETQSLQHQLRQTQYQLEHLIEAGERKVPLVDEWLQAAWDTISFIKKNYRLTDAVIQVVEKFDLELQSASQTLQDGFRDAALLSAQTVYRALTDFYIELESQRNELEIKRHQAIMLAASLLNAADENKHCSAVDLEGHELEFNIDVDYWSKRKLSRLIGQINHLAASLEDDCCEFDIENINHIIFVTLPMMMAELESILNQAKMAAVHSQIRQNIAVNVVHALEGQGFFLQSSKYSHDDMRLDYLAHMENVEGNQLLVKIKPLPGTYVENDIQIESFDKEIRTEHELLQRAKEIKSALMSYGLHVGSISNLQDIKNEQRYLKHNHPSIPLTNHKLNSTVSRCIS